MGPGSGRGCACTRCATVSLDKADWLSPAVRRTGEPGSLVLENRDIRAMVEPLHPQVAIISPPKAVIALLREGSSPYGICSSANRCSGLSVIGASDVRLCRCAGR